MSLVQHYASLLHWVVDALMHRRRVLSAVCCLLFAVCKTEEHHRDASAQLAARSIRREFVTTARVCASASQPT
ncbi:hypothetical protein [Xanthomonas campestris]|uniref:hypothetical protein n=1 Tax=Xanthomonas campestris TaxID=339 RepID=UPI00128FD702|nr:hypothetical protein [Xanthomonas campestris]